MQTTNSSSFSILSILRIAGDFYLDEIRKASERAKNQSPTAPKEILKTVPCTNAKIIPPAIINIKGDIIKTSAYTD